MRHQVSLHEVQEIARLAAKRRFPIYGSGPTVYSVSDALGLSPADVEALLEEIRQSDSGQPKTLPALSPKAMTLGAVGVLGVLLIGALGIFLSNRGSGATVAQNPPSVADMSASGGDQSQTAILAAPRPVAAASPVVTPVEGGGLSPQASVPSTVGTIDSNTYSDRAGAVAERFAASQKAKAESASGMASRSN